MIPENKSRYLPIINPLNAEKEIHTFGNTNPHNYNTDEELKTLISI
jgi:hypothetical protein